MADNLQFKNLIPPISLLQAREMTPSGLEALLKDVSKKLNQRRPKNHPRTHNFLNTIEKLLRNKRTLRLKELLP